jgi:hypothetical protein
MSSKIYWASEDKDKLHTSIVKKIQDYYSFMMSSNRMNLWKRSYEYYNRGSVKSGRIIKAGQHGEFSLMDVNQYRSLLQGLLTLTCQQRPALEPRATNTDTESVAQTKLAHGLLEYYMREKRVERFLKQSVEHALVFAEGFIGVEWDASGGKEYGVNPETNTMIFEGDLRFTNYSPDQVIRDYTKSSPNHHDWYITQKFENRYMLAAEYPELADKILASPTKSDTSNTYRYSYVVTNESDDVPVYTFWHRKCAVMPNGRMTTILENNVTLTDGPLPYRHIPVYRIAPDSQMGSPFGYTIGWDLLPLQEAINSLYSTVVTNQSTFGVQNIACPKGSNIQVASLAGGLNLVEFDQKLGPPVPLNLTSTPPEIFNFINKLETTMETLSGVNAVARGNVQQVPNLKSGNALALVQSMAIQFNSGLIQSYTELLEDIGTAMINTLKDYAQVPRVAMIAGKTNKSYMKEFSGKDLNLIQRVVVDSASPLGQTAAGKLEIATNLLQSGLIETPDQYIQVMTTGKLEPMIEGKQSELYCIKSENEALSNTNMQTSMKVQAIFSDNHALHIMEHKNVLSSVEARQDPQIVNAVLAHMQEHIQLLETVDPKLMQLMHQQPLPPDMPPNAGPMGPPSNPNGPVPQANIGKMGPGAAPVMQNQPQAPQQRPIQMPKNPMTGNPGGPQNNGGLGPRQ